MPGMRCERGQATIEWVGMILLVSVALGALATAPPGGGERSFGESLSERVFCAMGAGGACRAGREAHGPAAGPLAHGGLFGRHWRPASVAASGPCTVHSCNPIGSHCTVVYEGRRGRAFCKKRAAAEEPSDLTKFLRSRFKGCVIGGVGAKAFTPFADELLQKEATKSVKNAFRALRKGLRRAKHSVVKGKVKPGLIGCLGGTIGL